MQRFDIAVCSQQWAFFVAFGWGKPDWIIKQESRVNGYSKIERGPL